MQECSEIWSATIHSCSLPDADRINQGILTAFATLSEKDFVRRTHFFDGRFENLYLDPSRIPEQQIVLARAEECARAILSRGARPLRCGSWFNAQGPGQSTSLHSHEELDELLSGVYYVKVPEGSGDLVLQDGGLSIRVTPQAGMFLFFAPSQTHRVERNHGRELRLSLAFNFGPVPGEGDD